MHRAPLLTAGSLALFLGTAQAARADAVVSFDPSPVPAAAPSPAPAPTQTESGQTIALNFDLPATPANHRAAKATPPVATPTPQPASPEGDRLFAGGSDSLVARAVGHAEGTRSVSGETTRAYHGHTDPGNRRWNLGSFSYQHCDRSCSPEEADQRQLRRLQAQWAQAQARIDRKQLPLNLEETLNGIDLANQAPLAVLDSPGYLERLKQARQQGLKGSAAILWARKQAYFNEATARYEAPGLCAYGCSTAASVEHDQRRRQQAIAQVITTSQPTAVAKTTLSHREQIANQVIFQDLP